METVTSFLERLHSSGVKLSAQNGQLSCYAQKGALTRELREGIVRFKPELLALLDARPRELPLSEGQKGLYVLQTLRPASSSYNVPLCFRVNADVDPRRLAGAWQRVLDRYPILTARIVDSEHQRFDPACRTTLREHAFDGDDAALLAFVKTLVKTPFDLNRGPLTRIDWIVQRGAKPVLLITVHHIVFDGASAVILLKALLEQYGVVLSRSEGPSPHLGYASFVTWEETMLASSEGASHLRYWQQQLGDDPPAIELPGDLDGIGTEGTTFVDDLPNDLCVTVRESSRTHALPPSVIFLAAFQLLLHRECDADDVVVGMPVMGRPSPQFASEIGYFINMVPLRARCGAAMRAVDFLRKTQGTLLDALYHSTYPYPRLVEALAAGRRERNPLFRISYAYQNFVRPADFLSLIQQQLFQLETVPGIWQEGDFDFGLEIYEGEGAAFRVHLKYNPARYSRERIAAFYERYCALLGTLLADPNAPTSFRLRHALTVDSRMQAIAERRGATYANALAAAFVILLQRYSGSVGPIDADDTFSLLLGRIENIPRKRADVALVVDGDAVAFEYDPSRVTQPAIARMAAHFEALCRAIAAKPIAKIRTLELLGAEERERVLVEFNATRVEVPANACLHDVLPDDPRAHTLAAALQSHGVVPESIVACVREAIGGVLRAGGAVLPLDPHHPELAHILQDSQAPFVVAPEALRYRITPLLAPDAKFLALETLLAHRGASVRNDVTPQNAALVVYPNTPKPKALVYEHRALVHRANGENLFDGELPFIVDARPIANTRVYVLDAQNRPQPIGVAGAVHVAGETIPRGWLHRSRLTQETFADDPFVAGARMFRTGDRARWLDDATLQLID